MRNPSNSNKTAPIRRPNLQRVGSLLAECQFSVQLPSDRANLELRCFGVTPNGGGWNSVSLWNRRGVGLPEAGPWQAGPDAQDRRETSPEGRLGVPYAGLSAG